MPLKYLSSIHKVSRQICLYLEKVLNKTGLSSEECHVLSYLNSYPSSISVMQTVFGFKQSTLTSLLDRLEGKRLIKRKLNPDDRRSFLVSVTKKGAKLADLIQKELDLIEKKMGRLLKKSDAEGYNNVIVAIGKVTNIKLK